MVKTWTWNEVGDKVDSTGVVKLTQAQKQTIADEWNEIEKKYKDQLLEALRQKRNRLLSETDWWGVSDNTMTDAQKKYRKDLRDLTTGLDTEEKILNVTWPTKP
tara:strand:- start:408 stop:719 length:312 start_codon:yes stop_codon:yes gene_type:complete